jgi:hypothetical protein
MQSLIPPYLRVSGSVNRKYVVYCKGTKSYEKDLVILSEVRSLRAIALFVSKQCDIPRLFSCIYYR